MKSLNKERAFKCVWRIKGQQQVLERIQKNVDARTENSKTNAQLSGAGASGTSVLGWGWHLFSYPSSYVSILNDGTAIHQ